MWWYLPTLIILGVICKDCNLKFSAYLAFLHFCCKLLLVPEMPYSRNYLHSERLLLGWDADKCYLRVEVHSP